MEYYNKFSCDYENILKRDVVCPVTKIQVLDHNEFPMYEIQDDIVRDSDNISFSYAQGTQGKISFEINDTDGKFIPNSNSPFWYNKKFKFWKVNIKRISIPHKREYISHNSIFSKSIVSVAYFLRKKK